MAGYMAAGLMYAEKGAPGSCSPLCNPIQTCALPAPSHQHVIAVKLSCSWNPSMPQLQYKFVAEVYMAAHTMSLKRATANIEIDRTVRV